MGSARRGSTLIELLVAMSIFAMVSASVVVLMQHARVVRVWGDKKDECLRSNREILRRIGLVLRAALPRPAYADAGPPSTVVADQNAIISATTVARNPNAALPPFPAGHVETVDFWTSTQDARRLVRSRSYPVPVYPAAPSFDPRLAASNVPTYYTRMRMAWSADTGNLNLLMTSNDGSTVLATRPIVASNSGYSVIRILDFRTDSSTHSVGVYLQTRSRDKNSKFAAERHYAGDMQFKVPAWSN